MRVKMSATSHLDLLPRWGSPLSAASGSCEAVQAKDVPVTGDGTPLSWGRIKIFASLSLSPFRIIRATMKSARSLLVRPHWTTGEYVRVTPESAGWEHLHFAARRLRAGETWHSATGELEYGFMILGGVCSIESSRGSWPQIGRRADVFHGMPHALYLPAHTEFSVTAHTDNFDLAYGSCRS